VYPQLEKNLGDVMTYKKEAGLIAELIEKALQSQEIVQKVKDATPSDLAKFKRTVEDQSADVWNAAADDIARFEGLEKKLEGDLAQVNSAAPPIVGGYRVLRMIFTGLRIAVTLLGIGYVTSGFTIGWALPNRWLNSTVGWGLIVALIGIAVVAYLLYRPRKRAYDETRAALKVQTRIDLRVEETEREIQVGRSAIRTSLLEKGVMRALRTVIDEHFAPNYSTTLSIRRAPGLDGGPTSSMEVSTEAHAQLQFMLGAMRGGSIGISGPRGAGKTTLIRSVCREGVHEIQDRAALTIFTSAPVEYVAREFLLHLFATICHQVLERGDKTYRRSEWQKYGQEENDTPKAVGRLALWLAVLCLWAAPAALFFSLILAGINVDYTDYRTAVNQAEHDPKRPAVVKPDDVPMGEFMHELGLAPSSLWNAGFALGGFAAFLIVAAGILASRISREAANTAATLPVESGKVATREDDDPSLARWARRTFRLIGYIRGLFGVFAPLPPKAPVASLLAEARAWLTDIKFQQSFTSGWSGTLRLGIGLEGGVNRAKSLAQMQLTLPEIVDGLSRFLARVSLDYSFVIIGIDELDKLESDTKASDFLNEIKAIFGIQRVYYLISVSENAMSNFERRGLPFRDAFDSAFDDVIHVPYLKFRMARRLLGERVVGMPVQFQALCFVLSGGLARELIRTSRDLINHRNVGASAELEDLCRELILEDLRSKVRAIAFAVEKIRIDPARGELLSHLAGLEHGAAIAPDDLEARAKRLQEMWGDRARGEANRRRRKDLERLATLAQEAAAYLQFLALVRRFFTNQLDQPTFELAQKSDQIDGMALIRQTLSVDHNVTRALLELGPAKAASLGAVVFSTPMAALASQSELEGG
jgi:hypothetical protein